MKEASLPHKKPKPNLIPLASRIRLLRIQKPYSQSEIAHTLNISQPAYAKKEAGFVRFKREELKLLAQFFQIPIWELHWEESQQQAFAKFAKEKGFIPEADCKRELDNCHQKIQLLERKITRLEDENKTLKADKKILHTTLSFIGGGK